MNGSLVHVRKTDRNSSKKKLNSIQLFFEPSRIVSEDFFFSSSDENSLQWVMWQNTCSRGVNKQDAREIFSFIQISFVSVLLYYTVILLYRFYYISLKTVRTDPNGNCILDQNGTEKKKKTFTFKSLLLYPNISREGFTLHW